MTTLAGYHGFIFRPSYKKIADLPVAERAAEMRRPEVRERILERGGRADGHGRIPAGDGGDEQSRSGLPAGCADRLRTRSIEIDCSDRLKRLGKDPAAHYYDLLTAGDGGAFFAALTSNFHDGTLEPSREMLLDRYTVSGLSDAGAHVMMISDCSSSTFHLTHWVRDRTKGPRVPLETAVHKLTGAPAQMYGFTDRGFIREGMRADINVIDLERLTIEEPFIRADLPTGRKANTPTSNRIPGQTRQRCDGAPQRH